jgi:hypothetical protein
MSKQCATKVLGRSTTESKNGASTGLQRELWLGKNQKKGPVFDIFCLIYIERSRGCVLSLVG